MRRQTPQVIMSYDMDPTSYPSAFTQTKTTADNPVTFLTCLDLTARLWYFVLMNNPEGSRTCWSLQLSEAPNPCELLQTKNAVVTGKLGSGEI